jgi:hypothetical protein
MRDHVASAVEWLADRSLFVSRKSQSRFLCRANGLPEKHRPRRTSEEQRFCS